MQVALIAFSSSTMANRLKKLAANEGIYPVTMIQTPKIISQNGCTYSLKCDMNALHELLHLADHYGIKHGFVYREFVGVDGRKSYTKL